MRTCPMSKATFTFKVLYNNGRFMMFLTGPGTAEAHQEFLKALVREFGPAPSSVRVRGSSPMEHLSLDDHTALKWWSDTVADKVESQGRCDGLFSLQVRTS